MKAIFSDSSDPFFNLAAEEYLFSTKRETYIFLYVNQPSVIIGSNQAVRNEVNWDFCVRKKIHVVRRLSGGGAVYHDLGNLNYSFISDKPTDKLPVNADFLIPIVEILVSLNIPVKIGKRKDLWLPSGYKISGTASHISKNRVMYHGTLLYDADLENLHSALSPVCKEINSKATASVVSPVKNMRQFLKETVNADVFFSLFIEKLKKYYHLDKLSFLSVADKKEILLLVDKKYNQDAWNLKM